MRRASLAGLLAAALVAGPARADTVVTRWGERLQGKVTRREGGIHVELPGGFGVTLRHADVVEVIEEGKAQRLGADKEVTGAPGPAAGPVESPAEEYARRAKALRADDAEGAAALATFCAESGLEAEARRLAERALARKPDLRAAHLVLGHLEHAGRWYEDEPSYQRARGYVQVRGAWVLPSEVPLAEAGLVEEDGAWRDALEVDERREAAGLLLHAGRWVTPHERIQQLTKELEPRAPQLARELLARQPDARALSVPDSRIDDLAPGRPVRSTIGPGEFLVLVLKAPSRAYAGGFKQSASVEGAGNVQFQQLGAVQQRTGEVLFVFALVVPFDSPPGARRGTLAVDVELDLSGGRTVKEGGRFELELTVQDEPRERQVERLASAGRELQRRGKGLAAAVAVMTVRTALLAPDPELLGPALGFMKELERSPPSGR